MPRVVETMTWEAVQSGHGRWCKRHGKRRYRVSIRELSELYPSILDGKSRSGSRAAANAWWADKLRELEAAKNAPAVRVAKIVRDFQHTLRTQAAEARDLTLLAEIDLRISRIESLLQNGKGIDGLTLREPDGSEESEIELVEVGKRLPTTMAKHFRREVLRRESARFDEVLPVTLPECSAELPEDRTLETVSARWLAEREAAARRKPVDGVKEYSTGRFGAIRAHMRDVVSVFGAATSVDTVNSAESLTRYRNTQLAGAEQGTIAYATARARLAVAKQFLRWMFENELTDKLPRNISSRGLTIPNPSTEPQVFGIEQFATIYQAAEKQLKIWLLLMANCGVRQSDIASLTVGQVDFANGTLTHARVKTKKTGAPKVTYWLWPELIDALQQHAEHEQLVGANALLFTDSANGEDQFSEVEMQRVSRRMDREYRKLIRELKIPDADIKSIGKLRTTGATMIRRQFGHEIQQLWLGHHGTDVASRHYTASAGDERLRVPCDWLRGEYGLPLPEATEVTE